MASILEAANGDPSVPTSQSYFSGNRRKSFAAAQLRDDDEMDGRQAGPSPENL